jgi:hypothetical protein
MSMMALRGVAVSVAADMVRRTTGRTQLARGLEVRRGRPLPRLLAGVLLLGVAESMVSPYVVLFGADRAHLSPFAIGVAGSVSRS